MIKILILLIAGYLAFRLLTKPRLTSPGDTPEVEDDVYADYEEVKE